MQYQVSKLMNLALRRLHKRRFRLPPKRPSQQRFLLAKAEFYRIETYFFNLLTHSLNQHSETLSIGSIS